MVMLQTERLILREFTMDDATALNAVDAHPDVARWLGFSAPTLEGTQRYVESVMRDASESPRTFYTFAIAMKADDRLIGRCGFDLTGPESALGMVGYALHRDSWGQGLMTEAVRALAGYGFEEMGLHRIWADVDPENIGSWRVLEKIGMRREGHLRENAFIGGEWRHSYVYAILAREWA